MMQEIILVPDMERGGTHLFWVSEEEEEGDSTFKVALLISCFRELNQTPLLNPV